MRNRELFHEVTAFLKKKFGQMQSKNEVISMGNLKKKDKNF